jgi:phage shock protein E
MSPFQWTLLVLIGLLVLFVFWKRRGDISVPDARALIQEGALLLDVRTQAEFSAGHLPDAKNVPLAQLEHELQKLGPKGRAIVVYCLSGARSAVAAGVLKRAGFEKVKNLGAMSRW